MLPMDTSCVKNKPMPNIIKRNNNFNKTISAEEEKCAEANISGAKDSSGCDKTDGTGVRILTDQGPRIVREAAGHVHASRDKKYAERKRNLSRASYAAEASMANLRQKEDELMERWRRHYLRRTKWLLRRKRVERLEELMEKIRSTRIEEESEDAEPTEEELQREKEIFELMEQVDRERKRRVFLIEPTQISDPKTGENLVDITSAITVDKRNEAKDEKYMYRIDIMIQENKVNTMTNIYETSEINEITPNKRIILPIEVFRKRYVTKPNLRLVTTG